MVSQLRTAMAPTVPQIIARCCRYLGTLRAASAITMALPPQHQVEQNETFARPAVRFHP